MSDIRYEQQIPAVLSALGAVHHAIDERPLERKLHHLVTLRASQINGCAFCVRMHTREAREDGETNERLDRLVVWRHSTDFGERERAALAWTEALTHLHPDTDYAALRAQLRACFTEPEIAALTATVAMINLWNRFQVARH
ncbi:carboxymuconolactone decarboxylase family protein [Sandaracinus amylolyticus]|uniref:4-carboxymuconolactone decarboxylase n=1 Tax=Sandaracinus amylolyticus TaxID=927083 RepID=A0A0F6W7J7_9BACT|nr:carboxymuconolactone decarboxylase family protein [Sandaracinus amylolyticus]AKF09518.1 4-carboxymuconolactone decarboxylase [Sandaracinus amylolyticus]